MAQPPTFGMDEVSVASVLYSRQHGYEFMVFLRLLSNLHSSQNHFSSVPIEDFL